MTTQEMIAQLDASGKTTFEYTGADVQAKTQEDYDALLKEYPQIASYTDYLELLRATGGIYVENSKMDFGMYGFSGESVTSFAEGNFLDAAGYFTFANMMYLPESDEIFFAFDTKSGTDRICVAQGEDAEYAAFADSFHDFLLKLAQGEYPGLAAPEK